MANKTINDLTVNGTLTGNDTLELWQPSESIKSRKALLSSISKYVNDDSKTINNYSTFTKSYVPVIGEILYFNNICTGYVGTNTIIGDGIKAVNALPFQEPVYIEISADTDLSSFGLGVNGNELKIRNTDTSVHTVTLASGVVNIVGAGKTVKELYSGSWQNLSQLVLPPGIVIPAMWNDDPANLGIRAIKMTGVGVLRATYPDLDDYIYCGDANNATYETFYHADDAAGVTRNTTGAYLILPDARGRVLRFLDLTGLVDPLGASRELGDLKDDYMQRITGQLANIWMTDPLTRTGVFSNSPKTANNRPSAGASDGEYEINFNSSNSISPNAAKTNDYETSVKNIACDGYITY